MANLLHKFKSLWLLLMLLLAMHVAYAQKVDITGKVMINEFISFVANISHTRVTHLRGARFRFEYVMERLNEPQTKISEGWTSHACVDATTLRPTRMPAWLAEGIAEVEQ